jgi:hypothetical protein
MELPPDQQVLLREAKVLSSKELEVMVLFSVEMEFLSSAEAVLSSLEVGMLSSACGAWGLEVLQRRAGQAGGRHIKAGCHRCAR